MRFESIGRKAELRSANETTFLVDPLAFAEEAGSSNKSRPATTETANTQPSINGVELNSVKAETVGKPNSLPTNGVLYETPYATPAFEMAARWLDGNEQWVM